MTDGIEMFTVYSNPSDFPGKYVVRRSCVASKGIVVDQEPLVVADDLESARSPLIERGLACMARHPHDDPVIVEVWL